MNEDQIAKYEELLRPTTDNDNEDELLSTIPNLTSANNSIFKSTDDELTEKEIVNKIENSVEDKKPEYYKLKREISLIVLNYLINEGYVFSVDSFSDELGLNLSSNNVNQFRDVSAIITEGESDPYDDMMSIETKDESEYFDVDSFFNINEIKNVLNLNNNNGNNNNDNEYELSIEKYKKLTFGLSTIKIRNEIKLLILSGKVERAIQIITNDFPMLLVTNNLVYFRLFHLNLIEKIRFQHETNGDEKLFLDGVLKFINDKLSNFTILQNKNFVKELELTMALLCFGSGSGKNKKRIPLRLHSLLNLDMRDRVANLVNRSIIQCHTSNSSKTIDDSVEIYHKKASNLMTGRKKTEIGTSTTNPGVGIGIGMAPFSLLATAAATVSHQEGQGSSCATETSVAYKSPVSDAGPGAEEAGGAGGDRLVGLVKLLLWSFGAAGGAEFVDGLVM